MRPTTATPVAQRAQLDTRDWVNRDGIVILSELHRATNYTGRVKFSGKTTNATPLVIWDDTMLPKRGWDLRYLVMGCAADGSAMARYHERRLMRRGSAGVTVVSSTTVEAPYEDVPAWDAVFALGSNGEMSIAVTGDATTVKWICEVEIMQVF